jgi:hypothetical protein
MENPVSWTSAQNESSPWSPRATHRCIPIDAQVDRSKLEGVLENVATLQMNVRSSASKLRQWRRQALQRKGAAMHAAMSMRLDRASLAILDANGMVVCWYDDQRARRGMPSLFVHRHFSQFYVSQEPVDTALQRRLSNAIDNGGDRHDGWHKRADGSVFWGSTLIEPLILRNGTLQGFSHVTREAHQSSIGPHAAVGRRAIKWPWTATEAPYVR